MSSTTAAPSRVRLAILLVPKEGMSQEDFYAYWLNNHSKIFASIPIVQKNLTKYEQFHIDPKYTAPMTSMIPGYVTPPFLGMAIFEAESPEKIMEVFQDEEYLRVVVPDEENFLSRKEVQMLAGAFHTIVESK